MPRKREYIPIAPFSAWLNARCDELTRQQECPREEHGERVPANQELAWLVGIPTRQLYNYRKGLDSSQKKTGLLSLSVVERCLDHAGVDITDVYPERVIIANEITLEPDGLCPECRELVTPINGICPWCDVAIANDLPVRYLGPGYKLTKAQIQAAHYIYTSQGLSLKRLGELLYKKYNYATPKSCGEAMRRAFEHYGLNRHSQGYRVAGYSQKPFVTAYERNGMARCEAIAQRTGRRCTQAAAPGSAYCVRYHEFMIRDDGRRVTRGRLKPLPPDVTNEIRIMHVEWLMPARAIARQVMSRVPEAASLEYLEKVVASELKVQGWWKTPAERRALRSHAAEGGLARRGQAS